MPFGCSATGCRPHSDRAQAVGLADRLPRAASSACSGMKSITNGTAAPAPISDDARPRRARAPADIRDVQKQRHQEPDERGRADDRQHLRGGPGAGLPEQQQRSRRCRAAPRRGSAAAARGRAGCARPAAAQPIAPGDRQRDDQRRDAPAVPVDRPRFLDVAQPQPLDLGRDALEPLQALRPGQRVEGGDDRRPPPTASASRRFQSRRRQPGEREHQRAAEQRVGQPDRRQRVADRAPIVVRGEDQEAERGRRRRASPHKRAAARARRASSTQNSTIAPPASAR